MSLGEDNPFAVDIEAESPHAPARLEEEIHHVPGLRLTDCSNRFVRIARILGGGDHRLVGCQKQEGLVCQRLVACDAAERGISVGCLGEKKEFETYIAIATETAKCNIPTLPAKSRRRSSATCRRLRYGNRGR